MTSVFEIYGALCFLSLIAFLVLAAAAKLRPDLDEEAVDIGAVEKLKTLANSEQFINALPVEDPIVEILSRSAPPRPVKKSKASDQKASAPDPRSRPLARSSRSNG
jgi:hypothetical protein